MPSLISTLRRKFLNKTTHCELPVSGVYEGAHKSRNQIRSCGSVFEGVRVCDADAVCESFDPHAPSHPSIHPPIILILIAQKEILSKYARAAAYKAKDEEAGMWPLRILWTQGAPPISVQNLLDSEM